MNRKIFILSAHTGEGRFGQALADAYGEGAGAGGAEIRRTNLKDMNFDPVLRSGEFRAQQRLEDDLLAFQDSLLWCDHWTIVHPLWWGGMPGQLKSLLDRTLLPGFAFSYRPGKAFPDKLLRGRSARVIITSDTPSWYLKLVYGAGSNKAMKRQILDFVGFEPVRFDQYGPMQNSSDDRRKSWLDKVRDSGLKDSSLRVSAKAA